MYHAFRLFKGQDLLASIEAYALKHNIKAGVILSCVGCVYEVSIRLANGVDIYHEVAPYEIISITGTISKDGAHLHIALSDVNGKIIGGHLSKGCLINTTAEMVILDVPGFSFSRSFDDNTGYDELDIEKEC